MTNDEWAPYDPPEGDEGRRRGCGWKAYGLWLEAVRVMAIRRTGCGDKAYGLWGEGVERNDE